MIKQYKVVWNYWKGQRVELIKDASSERKRKKYNTSLAKTDHDGLKQKTNLVPC